MDINQYIKSAKAVLAAKEAAEREELAQRNAEIAAQNKAKLAELLAAYPAEVRPYASLCHVTHHGHMIKFNIPDCAEFWFAYFNFSDEGVAILPNEDGKLAWACRKPMAFEVAVAYAARQGEE